MVLHKAAVKGHASIASYLIDMGADVDIRTPVSRRSIVWVMDVRNRSWAHCEIRRLPLFESARISRAWQGMAVLLTFAGAEVMGKLAFQKL